MPRASSPSSSKQLYGLRVPPPPIFNLKASQQQPFNQGKPNNQSPPQITSDISASPEPVEESPARTSAFHPSMGKVRAFFSRSGKRAGAGSSAPPSPSPSPRRSSSSARGAPAPAKGDEMERVFRKFDANGDGQISRAELAALFESVGHAATEDEVSRMMEEADSDGDGCISLTEFATLMDASSADAAAVEEDLRHAFRVFDADGNGLITPAELARVLRGLGESATVAQCRRMIQGVDRNGDGLVSFDEFKIMMATGAGFGSIGA